MQAVSVCTTVIGQAQMLFQPITQFMRASKVQQGTFAVPARSTCAGKFASRPGHLCILTSVNCMAVERHSMMPYLPSLQCAYVQARLLAGVICVHTYLCKLHGCGAEEHDANVGYSSSWKHLQCPISCGCMLQAQVGLGQAILLKRLLKSRSVSCCNRVCKQGHVQE